MTTFGITTGDIVLNLSLHVSHEVGKHVIYSLTNREIWKLKTLYDGEMRGPKMKLEPR
jgi:hypothetical protein